MSSCQRTPSPTAQGTNQLLWGDTGILVRTLDVYDNPHNMKLRLKKDPRFPGFNTSLLPASLLHASLKASNGMFNLLTREMPVAGLLVGSKHKFNNANQEEEWVETPVCYPMDAGSNKRHSMLHDGKGCHPEGPATHGICTGGKCLLEPSTDCQCLYKQVPSHTMGNFFAQWLRRAPRILRRRRVSRSDHYACWFDTSTSLKEVVVASNSYWSARRQWSFHNDSRYMGWTECPSTNNVRSKTMVDAIVVQLPIQNEHDKSLCEYAPKIHIGIRQQLQEMHERGFGDLPVVFLEQARGMDPTECTRMWNGTDCQDGYRKQLFAQEYVFRDGSCLAVPDDCRDVYFFPVDKVTSTCNISSNVCRELEKQSPYRHLGHTSTSEGNSFSFHERQAASEESTSSFSLPSVSFAILMNLTVIFGIYFALRRQRGQRLFAYPSAKSLFLPKTCLLSLALLLFPLFMIHVGIGYSMTTSGSTFVAYYDGNGHAAAAAMNVTVLQQHDGKSKSTDSQAKQQADIITAWPPSASTTKVSTAAAAACPAVLPRDTRMVLLTVVQAFHGSTALASVLTSSPNIATYCFGRTWQCEGFAKAKKLACPARTKCFRDKRQLAPREQQRQQKEQQQQRRRDFNLLDLFSFDWNLTRPILHDKLFPREPGYTELWHSSLQRTELSPQLTQHGILHIVPVYVMMWTPLCVLSVQTKSRMALNGPNAKTFLQHEIWNLQRMQQQHQALLKQGTPVLVISYADLVFRETFLLERINAFLPCAGGNMTTTYLPQLNVDVFPENHWKVRGTVHEFSQKLNANECCGYDATLQKCMDRRYFKMIPEFKDELEELESYFRKHSMT